MLVSTSAIVLSYIKYSDTSVILQVFTEKYGRQSIMVYGISGKRRNKINYFQPLYLLDLVLYYKPDKELQKLKEFKANPPLYNLSNNIYKSTVAIFLSEVLSKSLKESAYDSDLYDFITSSIQILDHLDKGVGLFHLSFLLKLSRYLGFGPEQTSQSGFYYDTRKGHLTVNKPDHQGYLTSDEFENLSRLYKTSYPELYKVTLTTAERDKIFEAALTLYRHHVTNFNQVKSYAVLKEVFSTV